VAGQYLVRMKRMALRKGEIFLVHTLSTERGNRGEALGKGKALASLFKEGDVLEVKAMPVPIRNQLQITLSTLRARD